MPPWMEGVSFPGFHFHALVKRPDGRLGGGRVEGCRISDPLIQWAPIDRFQSIFPWTRDDGR